VNAGASRKGDAMGLSHEGSLDCGLCACLYFS
jgi:hypothetical protein